MKTQRWSVGVGVSVAVSVGLAVSPAFAQTDDYGTGTSSGTYCPQFFQTVVRGSSGNQVLELQKFLSDYYDIPPTTIQTSYFGRITQGYVIQFQKEQGLPSYGITDSMTRAAIARVCGISMSSGTPSISVSMTVQSFKQGDTVPITWQVNNDKNLLKHVIVTLDLYSANGTYVQKISESSGFLSRIEQWDGRSPCMFERWYCSFAAPGAYKIRATLTRDETGATPISSAETGLFNITTASVVTPPIVGGTDTYIDVRTCYAQYGISYQTYGLPIDYVVGCSITPITYSSGNAYFVELSVGPGQDCPAGCIYNHKTYIVANGSAHPVPNIHAVGRREVGDAIRKALGIDLNFFPNASKTDLNPQPKYLPTLVFEGTSPLLRYIFGPGEIVQGTYDVHADGSVTSQSSGQSTVLSRDQTTQIAVYRLAAKTDFSGYSLAGNPPSSSAQYDSNNRSWLFDVAAFPLRDGNENKPRCMITVYSETNVRMGCVPGSQTVTNWSTVLMKPIDQVRFQDY